MKAKKRISWKSVAAFVMTVVLVITVVTFLPGFCSAKEQRNDLTETGLWLIRTSHAFAEGDGSHFTK